MNYFFLSLFSPSSVCSPNDDVVVASPEKKYLEKEREHKKNHKDLFLFFLFFLFFSFQKKGTHSFLLLFFGTCVCVNQKGFHHHRQLHARPPASPC